MEQFDHIKNLFEKHIAGTITAAGQLELAEATGQYSDEELTSVLESIAAATGKDAGFTMGDWEDVLQSILQQEPVRRPAPVRRMQWWKRVAAAAIIVIVAGIGTWLLWFNKKVPADVVQQPAIDIPAPITSKAMITLANGQRLYLDSAANGQLAMQGNIKLVKLANGQIAYQTAAGEEMKEMQYNTVYNPRGSTVIDISLADGSKVWLNAGSSVTYPVAFIGNERRVTITGEAYFEVTHDASKPFHVSFGPPPTGGHRGGEVEVLGTHFNINAYDDEEMIRTTLLEGKIKVTELKTQNSKLINPGHQAAIADSRLTIFENVDLDAVIAWKNGKFMFNEKAEIQTIMRQLSRWYDVEVEYKGAISQHFWGSMSRTVNISQVLKKLEMTGGVHFKVENKKIIVMP